MAKAINRYLFNKAKKYMPGGVNSPVRAFRAVGGVPIFIKSGRGPNIYSEDGRSFIDYCMSWGALILGHAHKSVVKAIKIAATNGTSFGAVTKLEIELAKQITEAIPSIEELRLVNSGTEAVMGACRIARAYTGKNKIIKFQGSYHGHADYFLDNLAIPYDFRKHTVTIPYNNVEIVEDTVNRIKHDLAAIIVEPVAGNCGIVLPQDGFLQTLRDIANKHKIVLIFDEVITGFRVSYGGAQAFFGITPDITCLGKIIGGGLPVGAFGGKQTIMKLLAPQGDVYQAGTLSGNPVAVTAGLTTLRILKERNPYKELEDRASVLCNGVKASAARYDIDLKFSHIGSIFSIFFDRTSQQDADLFKRFYHGLLKEGIYFSPAELEANFLSTLHTKIDVEKTLDAINRVFKNLRRNPDAYNYLFKRQERRN